ncbi:geranylgeranylglycerol-phosphate geranylgeranyltransferase [Flavobacteriaceae bacterium]|jgi:4-hydroxybenzoate polyprenyltransferase|nr:geranylgeranylglycerol-phosphate geranylgeranyltransferase [Flavobacteriaceae bacterium]
MVSRPQKIILLKLLSLVSVVRGYAIALMIAAQLFTAAFILSPNTPLSEVLLSGNLWWLILATALSIAGGYIINNFYDQEKDLINRPRRSKLDQMVRQQTKLSGYFILNFASVLAASAVSFQAALFFSGFIFLMWYYSHRLKKIIFIGNLTSAILSVMPLFILVVYFKSFSSIIVVHACFLLLLLASRELLKDLENLTGDLVQGYKTIPVVYGVRSAKIIGILLIALTFLPSLVLILYYDIHAMRYYFYMTMAILPYGALLLWRAKERRDYLVLHALLRLGIIVGVFSIVLLNPERLIYGWF